MPDSQHFLFESSGCALGVPWSRRPICPIDPIEAKSLRPLHPALNGVESYAELLCHTALRAASPNGGNNAATLLGGQFFDSWFAPNVFSLGIAVHHMCRKTIDWLRRESEGAELQSGYALLPFRPLAFLPFPVQSDQDVVITK